MTQIIWNEWEIAGTFIYEIALSGGMMKLGWRDFESLAHDFSPRVAIKVEEDAPLKKLLKDAMMKLTQNYDCIKGLIVSLGFRQGEEIQMDDVNDALDCFREFNLAYDVNIRWGIEHNGSPEGTRRVIVIAFG